MVSLFSTIFKYYTSTACSIPLLHYTVYFSRALIHCKRVYIYCGSYNESIVFSLYWQSLNHDASYCYQPLSNANNTLLLHCKVQHAMVVSLSVVLCNLIFQCRLLSSSNIKSEYQTSLCMGLYVTRQWLHFFQEVPTEQFAARLVTPLQNYIRHVLERY